MKRILKLSLYMLLFMAVVSCDDDSTDNISFVTTYPIVTVEGNSVLITPKGAAFTDPGAGATVNGANVTVETIGEVNINEAGLYTLTYQATNADGFSRTASRQVVVYDPATNAVDLSGQYKRAATGAVVTVTKIAPSTYSIDDGAGFGTEPYLDVYFVHTSGTTLVMPFQTAPSSGITVQSIPGSAFTTATGFRWQLQASSTFGTAVRTFVKL